MVKHITKIRPYRVFKKDGRHFVKINNKKVFILSRSTKGKKMMGDKQIVHVVVNNLLAERKTKIRRKKKKQLLALQSAPSVQPANGKSMPNGKVDIVNVGPSEPPPPKEQAPTTDPLYARKQQAIADGPVAGPPNPPDMYTHLINGLMMGEYARAREIWGQDSKDNIGESFDLGNLYDQPDVQNMD